MGKKKPPEPVEKGIPQTHVPNKRDFLVEKSIKMKVLRKTVQAFAGS